MGNRILITRDLSPLPFSQMKQDCYIKILTSYNQSLFWSVLPPSTSPLYGILYTHKLSAISWVTNDLHQSPLKRGKKKINSPPFLRGAGGDLTLKRRQSIVCTWKFKSLRAFKKSFKNYFLRSKAPRDPPQSPLKRGKKKILPPF